MRSFTRHVHGVGYRGPLTVEVMAQWAKCDSHGSNDPLTWDFQYRSRPPAYDSVSAAKTNLGVYLNFFNTHRPHQSLNGKTPDTIYYAGLPHDRIAA